MLLRPSEESKAGRRLVADRGGQRWAGLGLEQGETDGAVGLGLWAQRGWGRVRRQGAGMSMRGLDMCGIRLYYKSMIGGYGVSGMGYGLGTRVRRWSGNGVGCEDDGVGSKACGHAWLETGSGTCVELSEGKGTREWWNSRWN